MELKNVQVLITGGSDGIGLGLAERYLAQGSEVLVTGRSMEKLNAAQKKFPGLRIFQNDIADATERTRLAEHVRVAMPELRILVNNAGIQRRVDLAVDEAPWQEKQNEIDILLSAPIHLTSLLIPFLLKNQERSLIVNVTSGGAYIPQPFAPVYSACKAALHSYTINLRYALSNTTCNVVELIPPAVKTSLSDQGHGADLKTFCDAVFEKLNKEDVKEIGFGPTEQLRVELNSKPLDEIFEQNAARFPIKKY